MSCAGLNQDCEMLVLVQHLITNLSAKSVFFLSCDDVSLCCLLAVRFYNLSWRFESDPLLTDAYLNNGSHVGGKLKQTFNNRIKKMKMIKDTS
jgi:hypothetical protein